MSVIDKCIILYVEVHGRMIGIHGHKDSRHPSSSTRAGLSIDNLSFRVYVLSVFVVVGFAALVVVVVVVVRASSCCGGDGVGFGLEPGLAPRPSVVAKTAQD
jgi:hypothetical protein